jgi:hypothetical protein
VRPFDAALLSIDGTLMQDILRFDESGNGARVVVIRKRPMLECVQTVDDDRDQRLVGYAIHAFAIDLYRPILEP